MGTALLGLGAAGLMAAPAAAQDEWTQQVRRILQSVAQTYEDEGYSMTHDLYTGSLNEGQSATVTITLNIGTDYQLMGVCDTDCSDIDAILYDPKGNEVDRDVLDDDAPIVSVTPSRTGTYQVRVTMISCSAEPCRFGIGAFGK